MSDPEFDEIWEAGYEDGVEAGFDQGAEEGFRLGFRRGFQDAIAAIRAKSFDYRRNDPRSQAAFEAALTNALQRSDIDSVL